MGTLRSGGRPEGNEERVRRSELRQGASRAGEGARSIAGRSESAGAGPAGSGAKAAATAGAEATSQERGLAQGSNPHEVRRHLAAEFVDFGVEFLERRVV